MQILTIDQVKAHTAACREVARLVNPDAIKPVKVDTKRLWWEIERDQYTSVNRFWKRHSGHILAVWSFKKLILTNTGEIWLQDEHRDGGVTITRCNASAKTLNRIFDVHKESGWYKKPSPIVAEILPTQQPCTSLAIIPVSAVVDHPNKEINAA